jgi:hypothetical protein
VTGQIVVEPSRTGFLGADAEELWIHLLRCVLLTRAIMPLATQLLAIQLRAAAVKLLGTDLLGTPSNRFNELELRLTLQDFLCTHD